MGGCILSPATWKFCPPSRSPSLALPAETDVSSLELQMVLSVVVLVLSSCFIKLKVKHTVQLFYKIIAFYKPHTHTHTKHWGTHTTQILVCAACVCVCIHGYVGSHAYVYRHVCAWVGLEIDIGYLHQLFPILFFELVSLSLPGTHQFI